MYDREIPEEVRELGPVQQNQVLDFAAFLRERSKRRSKSSLKGSLSHLNLHLTQEDFDEVRRESGAETDRDGER